MESEYKSTYFQYDIKQSTPGYIQRRTENNKQEIYSNCSLNFTAPEMELPTPMCKKNEIRCSDSWKDAEVKAQCEAYTARVCSGPDTYRNRYYLLCNHLDVPEPCYSNKWGAHGGYGASHLGGHGGYGVSTRGGYGGWGVSEWYVNGSGGWGALEWGGHDGYGASLKPPFLCCLTGED